MHVLEATTSKPGPDENKERQLAQMVRLELREAQTAGRPYRHLEGRAVPYDTWENVGWYLEQHMTGSFERSTNGGSGKKAPLLLFHNNKSWSIGHAESWGHEDDGMYGVWKLDGSEDAQRAAQMAADGHLTGLSVGFQPVRSKWELVDEHDPESGDVDRMDRVSRVESRLIEVSITPTPAFAEAQITLVRHQTRYSRDARRQVRGETEKDRWLAELARLKSGV